MSTRTIKTAGGIKLKITSHKIKTKPLVFLKMRKPKGPDPISPDQYTGSCGTAYNQEGARRTSYLCLEVLPFLKGKPLDEVVMAYVHSLRPSSVRVSTGVITLDACNWRVTIYLEIRGNRKFVRSIEQEVEVMLPDGVEHGAALRNALNYGLRSPQVRWHHDAVSYFQNVHGYFKQTKDGKFVKWRFKQPGSI